MKQERPVDLNLFRFHFPVMAIVSLLHRITGVIIFLFIPALLYILHASLVSQSSFSSLQKCLAHPMSKVLLLGLIACTIYHLFAGIRHLVMDFGMGDSEIAGRITAWFVIVLTIIATVFMGICLW